MADFCYHPDLLQRYPNLCGGIILASGMQNRPTPPELLDAFLTEQRLVLSRIGDTPLSEFPSLSAWRSAFRGFGVEPTKYRSAAEALLRRLTKKGDIPSINALVDAYNLVSIRYAVPMAAFDTRYLNGSLTIRFADGSEWFTAHDEPEAVHPEPGEVIFVDETGLIFARRWCWKQSLQSTTTLDTTTAIITVEAHHSDARRDVERAMADLIELLSKFVGGSYQSEILGTGQPCLVF
jgi:DNA/RNA-binding domain of Phe-tRNA-synthetase-like protein